MLITPRESELLRNLLHHGGMATSALIADFLSIPIQEARSVANSLVDRGWLVLVPLRILRGKTLYYQISRRSARYFDAPNAAAARYTRRDESCLQGLARFWFRASHPDMHFFCGLEEIAAVFNQNHIALPLVQRGYISETVVSTSIGICIYAFPALDHTLPDFVKSTFIRYSNQISKVRLGFVIDERRQHQLEGILEMFSQAAFETGEEDEIALLNEQMQNAESEMDRLQIERKLSKLKLSEPQFSVNNFLCPTITHKAY